MNFFDSVILGIVEGITEFLPISSTAHLILTSHFLNVADKDFAKTFEIAIQFGAILSVVALYWRDFFLDFKSFLKITVAFIPTAILGLVFYKIVKNYLLESLPLIAWSLLVGGILLILFEMFHKEKETAVANIKEISYLQCILIGIFQSIAMIPGVSRSGATILGGLSLGLKRETIVKFSFLLAAPTMGAATLLDLLKTSGDFSAEQYGILGVGCIVSFFVAILSIKFLLHYIRNHSFIIFGFYRIALGLALLVFFI